MKIFKMQVEDSFKNDSYHEVEAATIDHARMIARNLHIIKFKYDHTSKPYPTIFTICEGMDSKNDSNSLGRD